MPNQTSTIPNPSAYHRLTDTVESLHFKTCSTMRVENASTSPNGYSIHALDAEIYGMDKEIAAMEAHIDRLRWQRSFALRKRNLLSAISRLPPEILSEIFIVVVAQEVAKHGKAGIKTASTISPLTLSHICNTWRHIAFGLSELWTSVHCHFKNEPSKQAKLLEEWLCRANGRLLSIGISFDSRQSWQSRVSTSVLDAITPYCRQWRDLDLVFPNDWLDYISYFTGNMENLQSLSISSPELTLSAHPLHLFAAASQLCQVVVSRYYLRCISLPWNQLTFAILKMFSVDEALEVLRYCPNLTNCHFIDLCPDDGQFDFPSTALHHNIGHLEIAFSDVQTPFEHLLAGLTLPCLRHLSLVLPEEYGNPLLDIEDLIDRSLCPLESVDVTGPTLLNQTIIDFLLLTECVKRVTNNVCIPGNILDLDRDN